MGGAPTEGGSRRTQGTPQRAPERANAVDGPFSAACYGTMMPPARVMVSPKPLQLVEEDVDADGNRWPCGQ